jgi:hypothetical protein
MPVLPKVYAGQEEALGCDECGQIEDMPGICEITQRDLLEAIDLIRLFGWRGRRDKDRWKFICPTCVGKGKSR